MYNEKKVLTMVYLLAAISAQVNAQTVKNGDTEVEKKDGFDIININTPNTKGVSVNNLDEFNVKDKGTVINNIEVSHKYKTVHFGEIDGNKNIKAKEADIAVLNVRGTSNTNLNSTLEAASSNPLKVYIANENGINVDGGKFVNIDKLVLTTGVVDDNDMSVSVKKGDVSVSSKGISGVKDISIYSEKLDNKGKIAAENTKIVLGHNSIKNDNEISSLDNNYVSASDLGSIYGNDIQIQSTGYTDININELLAKNNIDINSKGKIKNNGDIISGNKIDITAKSLENKGRVDFGNNTHELKWIDAKGNVYTKEQLEKIWNRRTRNTLTPEYTFLYLTGSLLNQWATDEEMAKRLSPEANIFKRFDETLNTINNRDQNTFLIRGESKERVKAKHKQRDFVNKGDIYATEINDKKILEAVAVSNVKADQASIFSKNVRIELTDQLLNQDANIEAVENLNIKAKKLINKNSLSNDIVLKDGYENVSWDLMLIQKDIRANYDIVYEKGLVSDQAARKTKIAAVNKSQIRAKNIKLDVNDIELHDDINTGVSIKADKLETNSKKLSLKGQSIEAKEYKLNTEDLILNSSTIYTDSINIDAKNTQLLSKKDKEIVIKTDKENLTKEVISGSGIYAKNDLKVKADNLTLKGSIIKSDNKADINVGVLENFAEKVTKDYKSSYEISKSFRKIKHNEKSERAFASFIYAKDLIVNTKRTNNIGSYIVGTDSINHKSGTTKLDATKIKNELDKNYGVDNGILGVNYNKVKKMEEAAVGSIVLSKGDIKAKIDKELEIVGSTIKGKKILIEAEDVKISSKELDKITETESRQLLAGDLKGGFEKNSTLDNISAKVDMELYKNEKTTVKEKQHLKSEIEGEKVEIVAKKENAIKGSEINATDLKLKGQTVKIEDDISTTEIEKNTITVSAANKVAVNEGNLESDNKLIISKTKENLNSESSNSSNINAKANVKIEADKVLVKGSKIEGQEVEIKSKEKIDIVKSQTKEDYKKDSETVTLGSNVKLDAKSVAIVQTLKKMYDEKDNLSGYALNPVSGYQKIKEYKVMLEKNIDNIKELVDNVSNKKFNPESLGVTMNVENSIKYNTNHLTSSKIDNNESEIRADKVTIKTEELSLEASKIKGNEVKIEAEKVNLESAEKKANSNETDANVQVAMVHEVISQNTFFKGDSTVQNKGNYKTEHTSSKIEAEKIDLKAKELKLQNSQIEAKEGKVETDKLSVYDKADKETKYGVTLAGMYNGGTKIGVGSATAKVEHDQKVKNVSIVKVENGKVDVKKEDKKKDIEVNIDVNTQLGLNVDPSGDVKGKASGGAKTKLDSKGKKIQGTGYVGVIGDLAFEDGKITDVNVSTELKGDLTITPEKYVDEIKLKVNNCLSIDRDGQISNDLTGNLSTVTQINTENIKSKLNVGVDGNLVTKNMDIIQGGIKGNAGGEIEAIVKINDTVESKLRLMAEGNVIKEHGKYIKLDSELSSNANLNVKGATKNVSGHINLANNSSIKINNENGIKDYSIDNNVDGNLKSKGSIGENVLGDIDINLKSDLSKKMSQNITTSTAVMGNGNLKVEGKLENLDGNMGLNLNGNVAGNEAGLQELTGNAKADGKLHVHGVLEAFSGM